MEIRKTIIGITLSFLLANIVLADSSLNFKADVYDFNAGGGMGNSSSFRVNDSFGFIESGNARSSNFVVHTGLPQLLTFCGNAVTDISEACDNGAANVANCPYGQTTCALCSLTCSGNAIAIFCGDNSVTNGEQCDNGRQCSNGTGCVNNGQCAGIGDNLCSPRSGDGCSATCTTEGGGGGGGGGGGPPPPPGNFICGNSKKEGSEECDDGNKVSGDGCSSTCRFESLCGNGVRNAGEECDDGNHVNTDACTNTCTNAECGDGQVWSGHEQCDDGNRVSGDGCSGICRNEFTCGNGVIEAGEECEDGNTVSGDGCSSTCQTELEEVPPLEGFTLIVKAKPEKRVLSNLAVAGTVKLYSLATKQTAALSVSTNTDGTVSVVTDKVAADTYDVSFKGRSHLTRVLRDVVIAAGAKTATLDFTQGNTLTLLAGDVQALKDNTVNALDLSALASAIYTSNVDADLNADGVTNGLDISIAVGNLYKRGETL